VNLDAHVNHQVEITGTMSMGDMSDRSSSTRAQDPTSTTQPQPNPPAIGTSGAASSMPTLRVKSLRMLSATCSM